ncbi:MAG: O-antigen ligase family protein [Clostridia bacterium]|nr:O-antigen ligase family protein [Clostridia bacterium]
MSKSKEFKDIYANIRLIYIAVYMILVASVAAIPVRRLTDGYLGPMYTLIAGFGVILICVDFFTRRIIFKPKYCTFLIFFILAMIVSSAINIKYGFISNIKTIVWTCIQLFLLVAVDTELSPKTLKKHFKILTEIFCVIWLVFALISLGQFFVQYARIWKFDGIVGITREGFHDGRLFGVFTDPNYASLCSICAIAFALINIGKNGWSKFYHIFSIVIQTIYVVLSGSRTAILCLAIVGLITGGFSTWIKLEAVGKKALIKLISSILIGVFCFIIPLVGSDYIKEGAAYTAEAFIEITDINVNDFEKNPDDKHSVTEKPGDISFIRDDVENNDDISNNRFSIWSDYLKVFAKTPIWGTSPRNTMNYVMDNFDSMFIIDKQYSVHNSYLGLLVATGLLGAFAVLPWMIATAIEIYSYLIRRRKKRDEYYSRIFILAMALTVLAIAAFPLMFMFFNNMIIDVLFWLIIGYAKGLVRLSDPERYQKQPIIYRITEKIIPSFIK